MTAFKGIASGSRRGFLAATAATAATAMATVLCPGRLGAQAGPHRFKVGAADVTVLSDGAMDLPLGVMLPGRPEAEVAAAFNTAGRQFSGLRSEVNVAVVRIGGEVILVDVGAGPDFMPTLGRLPERLEAAGIAADSVTKVIFTHAHADHLWGVIDPLGGDTLYEKAEHVMSAAERDYWLDADVASRVPEAFRGMAAGTHRRLKAIAGRVKAVGPNVEILPGVALLDTAGHTPGHVSVVVGTGSERLLIGGDVLTQEVISFSEPGWRWGPDMDADRAIASRRHILDMLATDRIALLGYHLPWPGLGRVERAGAAFRLVDFR